MSALKHGWEPLPTSVWVSIIEHLPRPLTAEQAAHDLRVYASQVRRGRRRRMPGRPTLRKRWGWSDWQVRALMADEAAWVDPQTVPPARRQLAASSPPETATIVKVQPSAATSSPPARLQLPSTGAELHTTQKHKTQKKEGAVTRPPAPARTSPPSLGWSVEQVQRVWRDAWRQSDRGNPCRGRRDAENAQSLARQLEATGTTPGVFLAACTTYLRAQDRGEAFPASGVPLLGHINRVWRDYLPGGRRGPTGRTTAPWEEAYTSSPAPMWDLIDASRWVKAHQAEVDRVWGAIQAQGGGLAELRRWLKPRVSRPGDVLQVLADQDVA